MVADSKGAYIFMDINLNHTYSKNAASTHIPVFSFAMAVHGFQQRQPFVSIATTTGSYGHCTVLSIAATMENRETTRTLAYGVIQALAAL